MKRRYLELMICFCFLVAMPPDAEAEMVGVLMPARNIPYYHSIQEILEKELSRPGIEFLVQQPAPTEMAWKNTARKMKTLGAKVIIAYGSGAARAALLEKIGIPIVYCAAHDPQLNGLTGQSITGVSATVPLQGLLINLKKISAFSKLGILYSSEESDSVAQMQAVTTLGGKLGFGAVAVDVKGNPDSFSLPGGVEAVLLTASGAVNSEKSIRRIIEEARAKRIATAAVLGDTAPLGILVSLSASVEQQGKEAARLTAEILQGKNPAGLSAGGAPKLDLVINLKEAKELGFTIPFELMGTATLIK